MEPRAAILHYERVDHDAERTHGEARAIPGPRKDAAADRYYAAAPEAPRARVDPPPLRGTSTSRRRPAAASWRPKQTIWICGHGLRAGVPRSRSTCRRRGAGERPDRPGAGAQQGNIALGVLDLATVARPGTELSRDAPGRRGAPDRSERARVGRDVLPGEDADFLCKVHVPDVPGEYVLTWQMLSELEHWFDSLGSAPALCPLTVLAP